MKEVYFLFILIWLSNILILFFRRKRYEISYVQLAIIGVVVLIIGGFGALISSYLETGQWPSGIRYYGSVFFVIVALIPISKLLKLSYRHVMNYTMPVSMISVVIAKVNCMQNQCCGGKAILGRFTFPSRIIELVVAAVIFIVLITMDFRVKSRKFVFSIGAISYGVTRFVFESLREEQHCFLSLGSFVLTTGHIFCALITLIGLAFLVYEMKTSRAYKLDN